MDHGTNFILLYNKTFELLLKDLKAWGVKNYESEEQFNPLFDRYISGLSDLHMQVYYKCNSITDCYEDFAFRNDNYRINPTKNIINTIISEKFEKNRTTKFSCYENYGDFVKEFAPFAAQRGFAKYLKKFSFVVNEHFYKKTIEKAVKHKKVSGDIYAFVDHKTKDSDLTGLFAPSSEEKPQKKSYPNPFTDDEKFILAHYLFECVKHFPNDLSNYEIVLLLKIIGSVFTDKPLVKGINDTNYKKFSKGLYYSTRHTGEKKKTLQSIGDR